MEPGDDIIGELFEMLNTFVVVNINTFVVVNIITFVVVNINTFVVVNINTRKANSEEAVN